MDKNNGVKNNHCLNFQTILSYGTSLISGDIKSHPTWFVWIENWLGKKQWVVRTFPYARVATSMACESWTPCASSCSLVSQVSGQSAYQNWCGNSNNGQGKKLMLEGASFVIFRARKKDLFGLVCGEVLVQNLQV